MSEEAKETHERDAAIDAWFDPDDRIMAFRAGWDAHAAQAEDCVGSLDRMVAEMDEGMDDAVQRGSKPVAAQAQPKPAPPEPEWWWPEFDSIENIIKWSEGEGLLQKDWLRLKRLAGELPEEAE